jgi:hypothetical protein
MFGLPGETASRSWEDVEVDDIRVWVGENIPGRLGDSDGKELELELEFELEGYVGSNVWFWYEGEGTLGNGFELEDAPCLFCTWSPAM